jgi:hypothetical protein
LKNSQHPPSLFILSLTPSSAENQTKSNYDIPWSLGA